MVDREYLKQTSGYKRLLSMNVKDNSGPIQEKKGAFLFNRYDPKTGHQSDYGDYKITQKGDVKRQSAGPAFNLGWVDMNSVESYNRAFHNIADKMDQIREKKERGRQIEEERKAFNIQLALDLGRGNLPLTKVEIKNLLKKAFQEKGKFKTEFMRSFMVQPSELKDANYVGDYYMRLAAEQDFEAIKNLIATNGAWALYQILKK